MRRRRRRRRRAGLRRRTDPCCRLAERLRRLLRRKSARSRRLPPWIRGAPRRSPCRDIGRASRQDTVRCPPPPSTRLIRRRPREGAEARLRRALPWRTILSRKRSRIPVKPRCAEDKYERRCQKTAAGRQAAALLAGGRDGLHAKNVESVWSYNYRLQSGALGT